MKEVQLVNLDPAIEESLVSNPAYYAAMGDDDWARVADLVHQVLGRTLTATPVSIDKLGWGGYFVVDTNTREVVGSCAYKGEPTDDGTAEIAYFTYPDFEGRGYATAMARKLIEMANHSDMIKQVIAHTLPETNASTLVLTKVGMNFLVEVNDPDDGQVWRWQTQAKA